jgi:tetratricopeptide (TPR) repeat protein
MLESAASPSAISPGETIYRCRTCGIESAEVSCFAGIATEGPHRLSGMCITCNQPVSSDATWRRVVTMILLIVVPTTYLVAVRGTEHIGWIGLLIVAALIHPLLMALHEMGHAFTAKALGLEVNLITLGVGRFLWAGNILRLPIRLYAWPLLGLTYLGSQPKPFQRMRLWLTVLAGPATNLVLLAVAIIFWRLLTLALDSNVVLLWIAFNALTAAGNLWPANFRRSGQPQGTDGMQLLRVPFMKEAALANALSRGPLAAIVVAYNDGDYVAARNDCVRELKLRPQEPWLSVMLSACHTNLANYEAGRIAVQPLLEATASLPPQLHAAAQNNLAVALWLRDFNSPQLEQSLSRADSMATEAYRTYPCVLTHRSTHALLLASTNRAAEALALLEYINYERGTRADRAAREWSRAFAFRQLGREAEAEQALAAGLKLSEKRLPWLSTIGLLCNKPPVQNTPMISQRN